MFLIVALIVLTLSATSQHLENNASGRVNNSGTIRFKSDTGKFKNAAPYTAITNSVIEFTGTDNQFTDLLGLDKFSTALGQDRTWRVPGLVRYKRTGGSQQLHARSYTDLEVADDAQKLIPDSVLVGGSYTITASGPRQYTGTFLYDGTLPQNIASEVGLSGNVDRYHHLTLLLGPKTVQQPDEVRMDGVFESDFISPLDVEGDFFWGTRSVARAPIRVVLGGQLTTGSDISELHANVDVVEGKLIVADDSDTVSIMPNAVLAIHASDQAELFVGRATRVDVYGAFTNRHAPLTNTTFEASSLVHYAGGPQSQQTIQATASTHPYGNVRTSNGLKNASGDVYITSALSVNDSNVVMIPHTMSLLLGDASYTNNVEVVGAFRRQLTGALLDEAYVYNNEETHLRFRTVPESLTLDVRPNTRPNAYDPLTDIRRKVTVTASGEWMATVRVGYKVTDMPATWATSTTESLLKMYNAYGPPNERALKLTPTLPPTYGRRALAQSTGIAYLELFGLRSTGPDNIRVDNGNDILLRGSRDVLRAIASGRWSNPFTWDEAREPEPIDRVIIDGFNVHVGYIRANDNYAILELYPDSLASAVTVNNTPNSALLFGSTDTFNTFSFVPLGSVNIAILRQAATNPPMMLQDITAANVEGGLIVYPSSTVTMQNLTVGLGATVFNAGTLQVGTP